MRVRRIRRAFIASLTLTMLAPPLYAGDILDATVIRIASNKAYGEMVFIKTDKTKSTVPGCQTNLSWDFVMPLTTEHDKKLYAILLAARAGATPISINGSGNCDTFGSIETVSGLTW
ncbi:hypothetical protein JM946_13510 [Steroidobacter sp. S1-65]|uniref:Uncharacterized protein n=1 Tax=Steroidobacter gossypii TaxID=2805490 RepID=A0ABS1WXQ0_9GAMM|nr:hypothetical protein [Steroidobacter gossypii]MBM0105753.1 hypothetical protein [Steroidobacter gossypii]